MYITLPNISRFTTSFHLNSMRRKVDIWKSLLDSNKDCQVSFFCINSTLLQQSNMLLCFIRSPTPWPSTKYRFPPLAQPSDDSEVEIVAVGSYLLWPRSKSSIWLSSAIHLTMKVESIGISYVTCEIL
jgi:hypothetical protein